MNYNFDSNPVGNSTMDVDQDVADWLDSLLPKTTNVDEQVGLGPIATETVFLRTTRTHSLLAAEARTNPSHDG